MNYLGFRRALAAENPHASGAYLAGSALEGGLVGLSNMLQQRRADQENKARWQQEMALRQQEFQARLAEAHSERERQKKIDEAQWGKDISVPGHAPQGTQISNLGQNFLAPLTPPVYDWGQMPTTEHIKGQHQIANDLTREALRNREDKPEVQKFDIEKDGTPYTVQRQWNRETKQWDDIPGVGAQKFRDPNPTQSTFDHIQYEDVNTGEPLLFAFNNRSAGLTPVHLPPGMATRGSKTKMDKIKADVEARIIGGNLTQEQAAAYWSQSLQDAGLPDSPMPEKYKQLKPKLRENGRFVDLLHPEGALGASKGRLDPANPQHQAIARDYKAKAGGDLLKARELAQADGWTL